jgi:hypothetical protein
MLSPPGEPSHRPDTHRRRRRQLRRRQDERIEPFALHQSQHAEAEVRRRQLREGHVAVKVLHDLAHARRRGARCWP